MKKITKYEAKVLSLKIWRYFATHPDIYNKICLPKRLLAKIGDMKNACPLCELYHRPNPPCPKCPLESCGSGSHYQNWAFSRFLSEREKAAKEIVKKIQEWKVKND